MTTLISGMSNNTVNIDMFMEINVHIVKYAHVCRDVCCQIVILVINIDFTFPEIKVHNFSLTCEIS